MKNQITKLEDILALQLQELHNSERAIKEKINTLLLYSESEELNEILLKYSESSDHKKLKLGRMFYYILVEPVDKSSSIVSTLLDETAFRLERTSSSKIKTLLLISGFQCINHFKLSLYRTALTYALELELDTVADLLHQIAEWERKTEKALNAQAHKEFSKGTPSIYN